MRPWGFGTGIWGSMMKMKYLVWLTYLRRCLRLSKSDSWGFDKDLDNSLTGYLMSSLSCDIHKSLPTAVLKSEWLCLSHLTWSFFGTVGRLTPFVLILDMILHKPNKLSMNICENSRVVWPDLRFLIILPRNSTGWSGVRCLMCLRLKVFWISWKNLCAEDDSLETTRSSIYAVTMRLTWLEESHLVNAHGSDRFGGRFNPLRTWVKWICHDLGESLKPYNWRLRRQTFGSGYWISWGASAQTNPFESSTGVLRKADATFDIEKLHLRSWLIIIMSLRVVAIGEWAYFVSLSRTWVKPFPTKRALKTPERGPMTQRDSIILAWSSLGRSLSGSYVSWPELLREMSFFLMVSLISFLSGPNDHLDTILVVWDLEASEVLALLLLDFSLISKMPCLRELIMLISNSDGAGFPVTLLLSCWGWGSPGGGWIWTFVDFEGLVVDVEIAPSVDEAVDSGRRPEEWTIWETDSADSYLTVFFCWSKNVCLNEILEKHLIMWALLIVSIWFMSRNLELLGFWEGGWEWTWARTRRSRSPKRTWVIFDFCWTCFRMMFSHLIWLGSDVKVHVEPSKVEVTFRFDPSEVWVDLQVLSWWLWLDHREVLWSLSTTFWLWWVHGGLTWMGSDMSDYDCSQHWNCTVNLIEIMIKLNNSCDGGVDFWVSDKQCTMIWTACESLNARFFQLHW